MLTRKCDVCGAEMRMTTPRYKVTFDGWLYKSEKDICVPCFERIKAEIQTADTPQTEETCERCVYVRGSQWCQGCNGTPKRWDGEKIVDTPQPDCETCRYGQDKHRYAHICNECGVGINNYTPQTEGSK